MSSGRAVLLLPLALSATLMLASRTLPAESDEEQTLPAERPAMVFGSIEGVAGMKHVYIQKLGKVYVGRFNRPRTRLLDGGAFYFDDVPPGQYYLAGFSRNDELFWFRYTKESVQEVLFNVEPGGLHFMGSYRVTEISRKKLLSSRGTFDIELVDRPFQEEILEKIAPEVEGTPWAGRVERRIENVSVATME